MSSNLSGLLDILRQGESYRTLLALLSDKQGQIAFDIVRSARPFLLAALAQDWDGPIIFLTAAVRRAYNVSEQLPLWLADSDRLYRFAEPSALLYDRAPWDASVVRNRIDALSALANDKRSRHPSGHRLHARPDAGDPSTGAL